MKIKYDILNIASDINRGSICSQTQQRRIKEVSPEKVMPELSLEL